jgi:hypothetical protein
VCGGLGNQLFQLFTAYSLGLRTSRNVYVKNQCSNREFANKIIFTVDTRIPDIERIVFTEPHEFQVCSLPETGHVQMSGYFQASRYFDELYPEIVKALQMRFPPERYTGTVLHVRKTDYVTYSNIYVQLPKSYYLNCKAFPGPYKIVTDDKEHPFVKDLAKELSASIHQRDTYTDFWFLFGHDYIVCANSTFSWWASYFAQREHNATVLRPDIYLNSGATIE